MLFCKFDPTQNAMEDIPDLPHLKEVASGGRNQWFTGRTIGICCISHQAEVADLQVNHVVNLWRIEPCRKSFLTNLLFIWGRRPQIPCVDRCLGIGHRNFVGGKSPSCSCIVCFKVLSRMPLRLYGSVSFSQHSFLCGNRLFYLFDINLCRRKSMRSTSRKPMKPIYFHKLLIYWARHIAILQKLPTWLIDIMH